MSVPRLLGSITAASPNAATSELLVLLPSLGTTTELWDATVTALAVHRAAEHQGLRILRIDVPGHGFSPATREPFTMAELAQGVIRVVDEVGGGRFHVAGDSLGGAIALELAAAVPDRVLSLAMFCSGSRIGTAESWAERAAAARASGTASLVAGSAARWFAPGYLDAAPDGPGGLALKRLIDVDDESYALCCGALGAFDRTPSLGGIDVPALIVAGEHDAVTTPERMLAVANALPNARFVELAGAAHLVPLEKPIETAELLDAFLREIRPTDAGAAVHLGTTLDVHARGMAVRRAVLGDAHVDRAVAATTPETAAFQDFITRYAWGDVWARPELSRRERSIATLASLITGHHETEIRMHVHAALRNGLSRDEIAEVVLHTALYAGLPAANSALAIARDVFAEEPTTTEENHG